MNPLNWLFLNPPQPKTGPARLDGPPDEITELGPNPGWRKFISFLAMFLGVLVSFFVTGLPSKNPAPDTSPPPAQTAPAVQPGQVQVKDPGLSPMKLALIAVVITILSYPAFFFNLKLYSKTSLLIVFCVAFQNGYFWHALIYGVAH